MNKKYTTALAGLLLLLLNTSAFSGGAQALVELFASRFSAEVGRLREVAPAFERAKLALRDRFGNEVRFKSSDGIAEMIAKISKNSIHGELELAQVGELQALARQLQSVRAALDPSIAPNVEKGPLSRKTQIEIQKQARKVWPEGETPPATLRSSVVDSLLETAGTDVVPSGSVFKLLGKIQRSMFKNGLSAEELDALNFNKLFEEVRLTRKLGGSPSEISLKALKAIESLFPKQVVEGWIEGYLPLPELARYARYSDWWMIGFGMKHIPAFRARMMGDGKFLQTLLIEQAAALSVLIKTEMDHREDEFWDQWPIVLGDVIISIGVDATLVWCLTPVSAVSKALAKPSTLLGEKLGLRIAKVPENFFLPSTVTQSYTTADRFGSLFLQGFRFSLAGAAAGAGGSALTQGIVEIVKYLDPTYDLKYEPMPVVESGLFSGGFLGTTSNLRYHVVGALERMLRSSLGSYGNIFAKSGTFLGSYAMRLGNNYVGSTQWLALAELVGLQPGDDEKQTDMEMSREELRKIIEEKSN